MKRAGFLPRALNKVLHHAHVCLQGWPGCGRAARVLHLSGHMRITQLCSSGADEPVQNERLANQALLKGSQKEKFKMSCYRV